MAKSLVRVNVVGREDGKCCSVVMGEIVQLILLLVMLYTRVDCGGGAKV